MMVHLIPPRPELTEHTIENDFWFTIRWPPYLLSSLAMHADRLRYVTNGNALESTASEIFGPPNVGLAC